MILGEDCPCCWRAREKTIVFVTHSLGEAVFLADRVAVFSARPGTIKKIIRVDEPHPRKLGFATSEKFTTLRNELYALLRDKVQSGLGTGARRRALRSSECATLATRHNGSPVARCSSASPRALLLSSLATNESASTGCLLPNPTAVWYQLIGVLKRRICADLRVTTTEFAAAFCCRVTSDPGRLSGQPHPLHRPRIQTISRPGIYFGAPYLLPL